MRREAGFTTLEVLAALALVALVGSLVAFAFRPAPAAVRVGAEARQIAALLQRARADALAQQREARFVFDGGARTYGLAGGEQRRLAADVAVSADLAAGPAQDSGVIRFFPGGTASGGVIRLAAGGARGSVSVNWATGAVSVQEPSR